MPGAQQASTLPVMPVSVPKVLDVGGETSAIPATKSKATVLLFVAVDCPIANRMAPEIGRIIKDYRTKGVSCWMVYPDKDVKAAAVIDHMKSFDLDCRATIDRKHLLVKATGATVTPQAVVLDAQGTVRYLGRINDLYAEHGRTNPKPTRNDLREALDALLAGKPIPQPITEAIGCYIGD
jgi:hypothetical protein